VILSDSQQRYRSLDPGCSFHLEAPAGSGKTLLLTARFLRLLGMVEHPQQVLAMTFTNKAAGEMQERASRFLLRAGRGESSEDELEAQLIEDACRALKRHQKFQNLLIGGDFLRIQTFHSFCFSLVSQNPLEAGIAPGTTLLDEQDQILLLRETVDQTLVKISQRGSDHPLRRAFENRLLYLNNSWPLLAREMEGLMLRRDALGELVQVLNRQTAADTLLQGIQELVETELQALRAAFAKSQLGESWHVLVADLTGHGASLAANLPASIPGAAWDELDQWQVMAEALLTKSGEPRKQFGPKTGYYSGFAKTVQAGIIQDLNDAVVERLHRIGGLPTRDAATPDVDALWDLVLLVHAVMEAFHERCRAQRAMDFLELEIAALRLLDEVSSVDLQMLLDQQIHHLLIDEFQDTSYQQWTLLQRLCSAWSQGDGRSLFVVGDPKQSIYGFRKADVRLFMEARNGLPLDPFRTLPLEPIVLRTNFRSQPHLINWCNDLFEHTVMANPKRERDEVPFTPSEAAPKTRVEDAPAVPELALFCEWPDAPAARRREAKWLAEHIHGLLKERGADTDIGILLFTRTHLTTYLDALQNWGVPVQVTEGLKLMERPEVKYLWQLCRALVLPHDHLAWASQLHSPWLMLSYNDIAAVWREEPQPWVEKIRLYAEKDERVAKFWDDLREARQHLGHEPLARVVESAWVTLGGARRVGEMWGSRGLGCCRRFLDLIEGAEVHEPVQTLLRLEELLDNAYEPPDPGTAASKVCLMTVHRAKGLEFDTVYLPYLDWKPLAKEAGERPPYLLERSPGASERYLLAARPDRRTGERDPIYDWLRGLRLDRRFGEAKRLFYVAITRAKSRLYLSATLPWQRKDAGPNFPRQAPLTWLNDHYELAGALDLASMARPEGEDAGTRGRGDTETRRHGDTEMGGMEPGFPSDVQMQRHPLSPSSTMVGMEIVWRSEDGRFRVVLEPQVEDAGLAEGGTSMEAPIPVLNPRPFEREKPLFRVQYPSALVEAVGEQEIGNGEVEIGDEISESESVSNESLNLVTPVNAGGKSRDSRDSINLDSGLRRNDVVWTADTLLTHSEGMEGSGVLEAPFESQGKRQVDQLRLRGIVIHRLLETYGRERRLPGPDGVSSYLKRQGIADDDAEEMAQSALSEVACCLNNPWLRELYALPEGMLLVESTLEAVHAPGVLYVGVVDLAAFRDGKWWLVDFKTSRPVPEEDLEIFMQRELKRYAPQLRAYQEMWAKAREVDESDIELVVYWTAVKQWLVISGWWPELP
jgi:ATP-dependent helicase/nuclease subunit A